MDPIAEIYQRLLLESEITIHPANDDDMHHVMELEKQFPNNSWKNSASFIKPNHELHIAKHENKVAGYILTRKEKDSTLIVKMLTDKTLRKTGVGGKMLDHVLSQGNPVSLNVRTHNEPAISLYKSKGFNVKEVRPSYYSNGDDAYHMHHD